MAWNLDFHQLSKPSPDHTNNFVKQIQVGNILYAHTYGNCFARHEGESPRDMRTFYLPHPDCTDFRMFSHLIDQPKLIVSGRDQEIHTLVKPGYKISGFSIPDAILDDYCETHFGYGADKILTPWTRVIALPPETYSHLIDLVRQLWRLAQTTAHLPYRYKPLLSFESQLLEQLLSGFSRTVSTAKEPDTAQRNRILKRTLEFAGEHEHDPLSVQDLAMAANTSERTLRRLFEREFGLSPKKYLFGQRMYGAHRQLWRSSPSETRIIDVANAWGFWHMGQFARDYRSFFGELPSETLDR